MKLALYLTIGVFLACVALSFWRQAYQPPPVKTEWIPEVPFVEQTGTAFVPTDDVVTYPSDVDGIDVTKVNGEWRVVVSDPDFKTWTVHYFDQREIDKCEWRDDYTPLLVLPEILDSVKPPEYDPLQWAIDPSDWENPNAYWKKR